MIFISGLPLGSFVPSRGCRSVPPPGWGKGLAKLSSASGGHGRQGGGRDGVGRGRRAGLGGGARRHLVTLVAVGLEHPFEVGPRGEHDREHAEVLTRQERRRLAEI